LVADMTDEEKRLAQNAANRKSYWKHRESRLARNRDRYAENPQPVLERCAEYRDEQREKIRSHDRARGRQKRTGFSPEMVAQRLLDQEGKCWICKCVFESAQWYHTHADHCHETGKPRGLLCIRCNTALGAMKDSTHILRTAIEYLEHWEKLNAP
jgi:hypothetical protein